MSLAGPAFGHARALLIREQDNLGLWIPAAMGAGIAFYFSFPWEPYPGWTLFVLLVATACAFRARHAGAIAIVAFAFLCAALGFAAAQARTFMVAAPVLQDEIAGAPLVGQVLEASRNRQGGTTLIVAPSSIGRLPGPDLPARVRLRVNQEHEAIWPGEKIATRVMLWPPAPPVAPGAFDFARQAWFRQLGGTGITLAAPQAAEGGVPALSGRIELDALRERIARRVMDAMDGEAGPVAAAMMTGQRHAIREEVEQHLRDAGLAHILAISGLHMALFAGTLFWLARAALSLIPALALRYPLKKWAAAMALAGAFAYLLLSGMSVATQRAFIMAALMFLSIMLDRPALSLRNVALAAVLILLVMPESLLQPGFQMSFAAVTALVAVYQNRELQLLGLREGATGLSGMMRFGLIYIATLALTSLVAGAATAPFAAYHFNRVAAFGIVANLCAMPLVGLVIMPSALLAYLLMPFGLDGPALWVMEQGLSGVIRIAREVSGWEGAVVHAPSFPAAGLALMAFGGLWLALWRTALRRAGLVFFAAGFIVSTMPRTPDILVDGDARLVAVRQADGLFVWSGTAPRYARESWLRRSGHAPDTLVRERQMRCDRTGCVAPGEVTVAVAKRTAALQEDCAHADILIAFVPVRGRMRWTCRAALIIDRFDIAREGAHEIYLDTDGSGGVERIRTVRDWRGQRPWTDR